MIFILPDFNGPCGVTGIMNEPSYRMSFQQWFEDECCLRKTVTSQQQAEERRGFCDVVACRCHCYTTIFSLTVSNHLSKPHAATKLGNKSVPKHQPRGFQTLEMMRMLIKVKKGVCVGGGAQIPPSVCSSDSLRDLPASQYLNMWASWAGDGAII